MTFMADTLTITLASIFTIFAAKLDSCVQNNDVQVIRLSVPLEPLSITTTCTTANSIDSQILGSSLKAT